MAEGSSPRLRSRLHSLRQAGRGAPATGGLGSARVSAGPGACCARRQGAGRRGVPSLPAAGIGAAREDRAGRALVSLARDAPAPGRGPWWSRHAPPRSQSSPAGGRSARPPPADSRCRKRKTPARPPSPSSGHAPRPSSADGSSSPPPSPRMVGAAAAAAHRFRPWCSLQQDSLSCCQKYIEKLSHGGGARAGATLQLHVWQTPC
ncbi:sterile alpha motif domain-containing protein 1-like [Candoia aspera]|uniref:sterile alpha motif domain-containing protein 1-like n=1 Tax=Candoia aspera TaxID=51853 RepID=UPI002FD86626